MSNQHLQQQQIKEIFKSTNLMRIEATQNRNVLRQLDIKLIQLNHSLHTLEFHISRLQVDKNFVSCSKLVISVTEHLVEVVDKLSTTAIVESLSTTSTRCSVTEITSL